MELFVLSHRDSSNANALNGPTTLLPHSSHRARHSGLRPCVGVPKLRAVSRDCRRVGLGASSTRSRMGAAARRLTDLSQ